MTETITFGGHEFELRPLKLGQLRPVLDALDAIAGKSGGALIEAAARIVAAGLMPAHPELDASVLLGLEATLDELNAAVAGVLRIAGLQPLGESAAAGLAAPGSSSASSTPLSPPAAATATG